MCAQKFPIKERKTKMSEKVNRCCFMQDVSYYQMEIKHC